MPLRYINWIITTTTKNLYRILNIFRTSIRKKSYEIDTCSLKNHLANLQTNRYLTFSSHFGSWSWSKSFVLHQRDDGTWILINTVLLCSYSWVIFCIIYRQYDPSRVYNPVVHWPNTTFLHFGIGQSPPRKPSLFRVHGEEPVSETLGHVCTFLTSVYFEMSDLKLLLLIGNIFWPFIMKRHFLVFYIFLPNFTQTTRELL